MRYHDGFRNLFLSLLLVMVMLASFPGMARNSYAYSSIGSSRGRESRLTINYMRRKAQVVTSSANIREGAGTDYDVLDEMEKGDIFTVTGQVYRNGDPTSWYVVDATDVDGSLCNGYINESTFTFQTDKSSDSDYSIKRVRGTSNYLGLRYEPTDDSDAEIGRLYNGDEVELIMKNDTYAYVYSYDLGLYGFVKVAYLK